MAAPNSNDILGNARFSTSSSASSPNRYDDAPTASSILGATSSIDPSALHPLAGLVDNKDLDYLLLDDDKISGVEGGKSVLPSRGWGDELCYGTGSTYLAGAFP
jgi:import inner membrane translocase subunit TIM23